MMLPRRRFFIPGRKLLIVRNVAVRFLDGRTPSFFARIFQRALGSKAPSRVRDKDVYRSELTFDPKTSGLDIGKIRDIANDLHRTAACELDFFSDGG